MSEKKKNMIEIPGVGTFAPEDLVDHHMYKRDLRREKELRESPESNRDLYEQFCVQCGSKSVGLSKKMF